MIVIAPGLVAGVQRGRAVGGMLVELPQLALAVQHAGSTTRYQHHHSIIIRAERWKLSHRRAESNAALCDNIGALT